MISPHAALIHTMVLVAASDQEMTDAETSTIGDIMRNLPVFLAPPAAPSLLFVPSATQVVVPLVVTVVLLAAAVAVATVALIRSARPELLREAPP